MKKIIFILSCLVLAFTSCKKDTNSTTNSTPSPFTLKYEIITSSPVTPWSWPYSTQFNNNVYFVNGTGQATFDSMSGSIWTKTLTVTTPNRPFIAELQAQTLHLGSTGTVTGNIYLNGSVIATVTNPVTNNSGVFTGFIYMNYPIQ